MNKIMMAGQNVKLFVKSATNSKAARIDFDESIYDSVYKPGISYSRMLCMCTMTIVMIAVKYKCRHFSSRPINHIIQNGKVIPTHSDSAISRLREW